MRILQIGLYNNIGGIETFVMNYYRNIDRKQVQFDFVDIHNGLAFESEIKKLGGEIFRAPTQKHPLAQYKTIKKIITKNHYKTVHIHMLSAANIIPILAAKSAGAKVIVHSHNAGTPKGILRKILHSVNKKILHKKADKFWACSKQAGEWLFGNKKFQVIPNAIDLEKFKFNQKNRDQIRRELNIKKDDFVIGHVGRFEEQKNHDFLIDIFAQVHTRNPQAKLLLIGDGSLKSKIQAKVRALDLQGSVIFLGKKADVEKYYSAMDVFVLPSLFEGLPMVCVEAAASGLPCAISNKITNEAALGKNTTFITIDSVQPWCKYLFQQSNASTTKRILPKEVGAYNIRNATKKLTELYDEL